MELKGENLWSISDDFLFVACGLLVSAAHADTSRKKITVMRIPLPILGGNYIKSVHTLRYNTMLLMSDGEVYFFRSFKAMNLIKCLSGVRCLAVLDDGFSVIREEDQRLLLQMYHDIPSSENVESTLQYTFDITFDDKNIFQCEWQNDNYTLTTLKVTEDKKQFVQNLFGLKEVQPHYVHIFSIAGHVFVLTLNITGLSESSHQDYHIELLCVYASHVRYIRLLPTENLCLVFLSTGSVDIWYVSSLLAIKQNQTYHSGSKWMDYDATSDNGDIYYTDGDQLVRLKFLYNIQLDKCFVHTLIKPVTGIQACTWVDHKKELVCLSDNNIFYCISFNLPIQKTAIRFFKNLATDLKPEAIGRLRHNVGVLRFEKSQLNFIQQKLQKEYVKQNLISVSKGIIIFSAPIKMSVEFQSHVPIFDKAAVHLKLAQDHGSGKNSIYAVFKFKPNYSQLLLHSTHWKVLILHDNRVHAFLLPTEKLVKKKCRMVVSFRKLRNEHLPYFKLKLVGFIKAHSKMFAILLPLSAEKSGSTYCAVFSASSAAGNLQFNQMQLYKELCGPKVRQAIGKADYFKISRIASILLFSSFVNENTQELYFKDERLHHCATKNNLCGTLESRDASAIYYFKKHIISNTAKLDIEDSLKYNDFTFDKIMTETELLYGLNCYDVLNSSTKMAINPRYFAIRNAFF
ncbi:uncharacterized protein LOC108024369 isoform X5 [Drosophila biarmipes]|uniref:uncharacterized protein LOC108024369 isoform X5 n=1 Tax=Drosophila biarmipes TaxID=125945 RepID=UPI0021CCC53A|nr:uncharacterized protein LOC108024369 isoform X5 [Drosophila biarmipes]